MSSQGESCQNRYYRPVRINGRAALALVICSGLVVVPFAPAIAEEISPTDSTIDLVERARSAAQQDLNEQAAALFGQALADNHDLPASVRREYADQLTFSGRAAEAVPIYRDYLATSLPQEERRRAQRGLALSLLWSSAYEEAVTEWEAVLALDPQDRDARENLFAALTQAARAAAQRDQNVRSASYFGRALDVLPDRRISLLREYADQLAFSGRAARAVPLFDEVLRTTDLDPGQLEEARRGRALSLLWSGQYLSAADAWDGILRVRPNDLDAARALTDALTGAARRAAAEDRNAAAAALFARAIDAAPQRRPDLQLEYADQLVFSERAAQAVPIYRTLLERDALGPAQLRDIMLRLALALSWSDQLTEALAIYEAVVAADPASISARLGRARVLSWLDRNRAALDEFDTVLNLDPGNRPATIGAAEQASFLGMPRRALSLLEPVIAEEANQDTDTQALIVAARAALWKGRPDQARQLADRILNLEPDDTRAVDLVSEIMREQRPQTSVTTSLTEQSDGIIVSGAQVEHRVRVNDGLTSLGLRGGTRRYHDDDNVSLRLNRIGIFASHRFNDAVELNIEADWNDLRRDGEPNSWPTFNTWLTIWPSDVLRFDLSAGRGYFDDAASLAQDIRTDTLGLSMDYNFNPDLRLAVRGTYGWVTDGNTRVFAQVEAEYRTPQLRDLQLGGRLTYTDFAQPELDSGYFNPDWLYAVEATARYAFRPADRWTVNLAGTVGYEWQPDERKAVWSGQILGSYAVTDRISLNLGLRHDDSGPTGSDGFSRTNINGGISLKW